MTNVRPSPRCFTRFSWYTCMFARCTPRAWCTLNVRALRHDMHSECTSYPDTPPNSNIMLDKRARTRLTRHTRHRQTSSSVTTSLVYCATCATSATYLHGGKHVTPYAEVRQWLCDAKQESAQTHLFVASTTFCVKPHYRATSTIAFKTPGHFVDDGVITSKWSAPSTVSSTTFASPAANAAST